MHDDGARPAPAWPDEFDRLLRLYCRLVADGAPVDPDQPLASLGVDSLAQIGLVTEIEDTFEVSFPPQMLTVEVLATPATVWAAVRDLRKARLAGPA